MSNSKSHSDPKHRSKAGETPGANSNKADPGTLSRDHRQPQPERQAERDKRAQSDSGLLSNFVEWLPEAFGLSTIDADLPRRLRALADDLDRLRVSHKPSDEVLAAAPLLFSWRPLLRPQGLILAGVVVSHPTLRGPIITTSPIWVVAPDLTWVRTTSRVYRLGEPAKLQTAKEVRADDL